MRLLDWYRRLKIWLGYGSISDFLSDEALRQLAQRLKESDDEWIDV